LTTFATRLMWTTLSINWVSSISGLNKRLPPLVSQHRGKS
jgi:hypothetical protein